MSLRLLLHYPIVHSPEDLGSLGIGAASARTEEQAANLVALVDAVWSAIEQNLGGLGLDFFNVKIFQDGLPVCGNEMLIVNELAGSGSRNHKLIKSLVETGAQVMGTESAALLLEEYQLMKQVHEADFDKSLTPDSAGRSLLERRDQFIAERIADTLKDGEIGILFMGILHHVEDRLAALQDTAASGIKIMHPLGKPILRAGRQ
jgi:hypothetical protein